MTDTEILDYLDKSMREASMPRDVQIGHIVFTVGVSKVPLRTAIEAAIERDKIQTIERVARKMSQT